MSDENPKTTIEKPAGSGSAEAPLLSAGDLCTWEPDEPESNWYETSCGESFTINDGTPADNGMKFCCFCGKTISR